MLCSHLDLAHCAHACSLVARGPDTNACMSMTGSQTSTTGSGGAEERDAIGKCGSCHKGTVGQRAVWPRPHRDHDQKSMRSTDGKGRMHGGYWQCGSCQRPGTCQRRDLTRHSLYAPNRRMALTSRSSTGDLYTGSMYDPATAKTVTIGSIFVPAYCGHPSTSVYFYE